MIKDVIIPYKVSNGITSNHRKFQMNLICIGADTETYKGNPDTFQLYSEDRISFIEKFKGKEFPLKQLLSVLKKRFSADDHLVLFWNNLQFDNAVLWYGKHELLQNAKVEFKIKSLKFTGSLLYGKVNTLSGKFDNGMQVDFIDLYHYFQTSVARLAKLFCPKLPKLKKPEGLGNVLYSVSNDNFRLYAMRDAEICFYSGKELLEYHSKFDVRLSISGPQFASRVFKHSFIRHGSRIPFPPKWIAEYAKLSFHGGRIAMWCEPGLYKNVTEVDIISAYPFAMTQIPNFLNCNYGREGNLRDGHILKVKIIKRGKYPLLYTHDFKYADVGDEIWVTSYEAKESIYDGTQFEVLHRYFVNSTEKENPLKNYVLEMFQKKEEFKNSPAMYYFYKVSLLNALYGKFIETRPNETEDIRYDSNGFADISKSYTAGSLYNPFIATLITGHTRAYLHSLEIKYKALHSSTDSILTQDKVHLFDGIGGLSIKAKGMALLIRPKLYILFDENGKIIRQALHGFWGTAAQLMKAIKQENLNYEVKHMYKVRESLRQNRKPLVMEMVQREINLDAAVVNKLKHDLINAGI